MSNSCFDHKTLQLKAMQYNRKANDTSTQGHNHETNDHEPSTEGQCWHTKRGHLAKRSVHTAKDTSTEGQSRKTNI